jgi:FtsP/CotA-like multicopper oxidase with cupredoxin domain
MGPGELDRRHFLAGAGGVFFCTLAGHRLALDQPADLPKLASSVAVPPKVVAADASNAPTPLGADAAANADVEYWIRAEQVSWDIVPTGRDEMMNEPVKGKTKFKAYAYRRYEPNFTKPAGRPRIPGPVIQATEGQTVAVHFQNQVDVPVTMHPHGIFYANEMDGAYKGKYTDPGGFVQPGRTFTYVWDARPGTAGSWIYHDHGPLDPVPVFKGLFGPLIIRAPGETKVNKEFCVAMHTFPPVATKLNTQFSCLNGRAYAGNTPTFETSVGDRVRFRIYAIDDFFHTFHIHGHRWTDPDGTVIDTKTLGPGDSFSFEIVEDNPGRWFYHCHVFSHLHMGMNGWYVVD